MKWENEAWRHRKRRSREEVKHLIGEFEASGLDKPEFCRNRSLALSTLQIFGNVFSNEYAYRLRSCLEN
jgi:hypothetical protein